MTAPIDLYGIAVANSKGLLVLRNARLRHRFAPIPADDRIDLHQGGIDTLCEALNAWGEKAEADHRSEPVVILDEVYRPRGIIGREDGHTGAYIFQKLLQTQP